MTTSTASDVAFLQVFHHHLSKPPPPSPTPASGSLLLVVFAACCCALSCTHRQKRFCRLSSFIKGTARNEHRRVRCVFGCVYVCSRRALELEVSLSCSPPARRATAVYFTVTSSVKVAAKYPNCCLSSPLSLSQSAFLRPRLQRLCARCVRPSCFLFLSPSLFLSFLPPQRRLPFF